MRRTHRGQVALQCCKWYMQDHCLSVSLGPSSNPGVAGQAGSMQGAVESLPAHVQHACKE